MDKNFFGGSENLYKYLVSIGILLVVLSIYYPLKQKQELEVLKISLHSELEILNFEIKENKERIENYKNVKKKDDNILQDIKKKHKENKINDIKTGNKIKEIENKENYITIYNRLFWCSIIVGIGLIIFGFCRWLKAKKIEDRKLELEKDILEEELRIKKSISQDNSIDQNNGHQEN